MNFMHGPGPRVVPLHIVEYNAAPTVDCVLCLYSATGVLRPNARGCRNIVDAHEHVQKGKHIAKVQSGGMGLPHVQQWGMNGTSFAPSPPVLVYRCTGCSLGGNGTVKVRHWAMPYNAMMQHVGTEDHIRRCGDGRIQLFAAAGVPWAVPVVAAPAVAVAVQAPVVVAPVPVVVPVVPVVVPRQPQP